MCLVDYTVLHVLKSAAHCAHTMLERAGARAHLSDVLSRVNLGAAAAASQNIFCKFSVDHQIRSQIGRWIQLVCLPLKIIIQDYPLHITTFSCLEDHQELVARGRRQENQVSHQEQLHGIHSRRPGSGCMGR